MSLATIATLPGEAPGRGGAHEGTSDVVAAAGGHARPADSDVQEFWAAYGRMYVPRPVEIGRVTGIEPVLVDVPRPRGDGAIPQWRALIAAYADWPHDLMLRIVACESGYRADAVSPDGANWGGGQVNLVHLWRVGGDPYALLDPTTNVRVMHDIWLDAGGSVSPWSCAR